MPTYPPTGHPGHHHPPNHRGDDMPTDLDEPSTGITFLSSTTTTITNIERDGDTEVAVKHLARFAIEPGAVADQVPKYGVKQFRPAWLELTWRNGALDRVQLSGQPTVKAGGVSTKSPALGTYWESRWHTQKFDRTVLPEPVAAMAALYEKRVVVASPSPTAPFL